MEIINIKSVHNLLTSVTHSRPLGVYSYTINCRQYLSTYRGWQERSEPKLEAFSVMTLEFKRIWITGNEGRKIAEAIQASSSPILVG